MQKGQGILKIMGFRRLFSKKLKGQASAELLIILAISLVALIAIFSISNESVTDLNEEKLISTAKTSVNALRDAANDVFSQGIGAKKQVFFVVPNGVDEAASGIVGEKNIVLNVFKTDVLATAKAKLSGSIPTSPGGHWVWVEAFENFVAIGVQNISVDKTSSFVTMAQSETVIDTFMVTNSGSETATININFDFSHAPDVSLSVSDLAFALIPGEQKTITLTYNSGANAFGNYAGNLDISAVFPTLPAENLSLTLNAEVSPLASFAQVDFSKDISHVFTWVSANTFSGNNNRIGLNGELDRNYLNGSWNTNLVGYWKFNSAGSGIVIDSSGKGNNGTLTNGASTSSEGLWDTTAGTFDGTKQYLLVQDNPDFSITDRITVSAWFNATTDTPIGKIGNTVIDNLKYDPNKGKTPSIIKVSDGIVAIAFEGPGTDATLKTIEIDAVGNIIAVKDTLVFEANKGKSPDITRVTGSIYAIAHEANGKGKVKTFSINTNGIITSVDSLQFESNKAKTPVITRVTGNTFAIAYEGPGKKGFVIPILITNNGTIFSFFGGALEFDSVEGKKPSVTHVSGQIIAIAYEGPNKIGKITTINIGSFSTVVDTLTYEPGGGRDPSIVSISPDIVAIAYRDTSDTGLVKTIQIDSAGNINPTIVGTLTFETAFAREPNIIPMSRDIFGVVYRGPGDAGIVKTIQIDASGSIITEIDSLQFDSFGKTPVIAPVSSAIFGIAYEGPPAGSRDGFITTIEIAVNKGIFKAGSFELDADTTKVFGTINNQTISAPISSGWNLIALSYDKDAPANQQKLYVNGVEAANGALTDPITITATDLLIGSFFNGGIDEVTVWNSELPATQLLRQYNNSFEGYFDANPIDSGAPNSFWASVIANGSIDPAKSCAGLIFGAGNSLPVSLTNTRNCIALGSNATIGPAPGQFFDYKFVLRNNVGGNNLAAPYIDDLGFNYFLN